MAAPGAIYDESLVFRAGQAYEYVLPQQDALGDTYTLTVSYDGDSTITIDKGGAYGSYTMHADYFATDAQLPYATFGTRDRSETPGVLSAVFGEGLIGRAKQFVCGRFNAAKDAALLIGNGTIVSGVPQRSNALEVDWDGTIEIPDSAARNKTARMLGLAKTAGDTIIATGLRIGGYITGNKTECKLTIHTPFRFYGVTSCTISGDYTVRQGGIYLFGSTATAPCTFTGHYAIDSINSDLGTINVTINTGVAQSAATNNDPANIVLNTCTITLT